MNEMTFIKPKNGLTVIDPATKKPLPESGASVTLTTYWRRRLKDGDVETASKPSAKQAAKPAAKTDKKTSE